MHEILVTLHSYNRYLLLAALAFVLFRSFSGWLGKKPYLKADGTAGAVLLGLTHLQLLVGLIMYAFTSSYTQTAFANMKAAMKNEWQRYFAVEHILVMIIAVVFIQLGRTLSKKAATDERKHRTVAIYTSIAVLLILLSLVPKGLLFGQLSAMSVGE